MFFQFQKIWDKIHYRTWKPPLRNTYMNIWHYSTIETATSVRKYFLISLHVESKMALRMCLVGLQLTEFLILSFLYSHFSNFSLVSVQVCSVMTWQSMSFGVRNIQVQIPGSPLLTWEHLLLTWASGASCAKCV